MNMISAHSMKHYFRPIVMSFCAILLPLKAFSYGLTPIEIAQSPSVTMTSDAPPPIYSMIIHVNNGPTSGNLQMDQYITTAYTDNACATPAVGDHNPLTSTGTPDYDFHSGYTYSYSRSAMYTQLAFPMDLAPTTIHSIKFEPQRGDSHADIFQNNPCFQENCTLVEGVGSCTTTSGTINVNLAVSTPLTPIQPA